MHIIDTHAHLDHLEDLTGALANADQAGVTRIVTVSVDASSCLRNWEIAQSVERPKIHLAMGMHPSDADRSQLERCLRLIRDHRQDLTAIGEIGLDFWYKGVRQDDGKKNEQREVFRAFLDIAGELDLPVIVHTRGTWRECLETVKSAGIRKAEFHWYSGPVDVLKDILDGGYFISAAPSLVYSPQSREAVRYAPLDRTLIETDSPVYYHPPAAPGALESTDGFKAEPRDVIKTLKAVCALKELDEEAALAIFNRNAMEFFRLA